MTRTCPYCDRNQASPEVCPKPIRKGKFYRKSDCRWIARYQCRACRRSFSSATTHACFQQNKRQFNYRVEKLLCANVSQREIARLLNLNRKTVARKLVFLGEQATSKLRLHNFAFPRCEAFVFDDLHTFEHTKCKPLAVTLAVQKKSRRILGFEVSTMAVSGRLAPIALQKYGPRHDGRSEAREKLFEKIQPLIHPCAEISSDENPHYPNCVKRYFPRATHVRYKGHRSSETGQGELKAVAFDPLFSLNHTCAMLRGSMSRLIRKTWCTTKLKRRLELHLAIYALHHNERLLQNQIH